MQAGQDNSLLEMVLWRGGDWVCFDRTLSKPRVKEGWREMLIFWQWQNQGSFYPAQSENCNQWSEAESSSHPPDHQEVTERSTQ